MGATDRHEAFRRFIDMRLVSESHPTVKSSTLRDSANAIVASAVRKALGDPEANDELMLFIAATVLDDSLPKILDLLTAEVDKPGVEDALHPGARYYRKMRVEGVQSLSEVWAAS